jgi:prepilin-type N-terminal cleavage/methylation domain-containing protein
MILMKTTLSRPARAAGFTLIELLIAFLIFALVCSGIIYGYVQSNRMSQFAALTLAAQSYASQGAEQARAANWRPRDYPALQGYGTGDELPAPTNYVLCGTNYIFDVPIKGSPAASDFAFFVTNFVSISNVSLNPSIRQIRSDVVWVFYLTGQVYTNTAILLRAPDQ